MPCPSAEHSDTSAEACATWQTEKKTVTWTLRFVSPMSDTSSEGSLSPSKVRVTPRKAPPTKEKGTKGAAAKNNKPTAKFTIASS